MDKKNSQVFSAVAVPMFVAVVVVMVVAAGIMCFVANGGEGAAGERGAEAWVARLKTCNLVEE